MQAFIYARVSSKEQEEGGSIPYQLNICQEYAEKNDLDVMLEFVETKTAGKAGREQFNRMLEALKQPDTAKVVLVDTMDRLTRNLRDYVTLQEMVEDYGVEFRIIRDNRVFGKDATRSDFLMQEIQVVIAADFIRNLKNETKKGTLQRVKEGYWCWQAPFGYQMVSKELIPDENAPIVKRIFELYSLNKYSTFSLAKLLRSEGEKRATKSFVYKILINPIYKSIITYQNKEYKGKHTPLVSSDMWRMCQLLIKGSKHTERKSKLAYHGVLLCGECGSLMSGEIKQGGKYTYYRCWKSANNQCDSGYINENIINARVGEIVNGLVFPNNYKQEMLKTLKHMDKTMEETAKEEQEKLNKQITKSKTRIRKAYEDHLDGLIDSGMFTDIKKDHEAKVEILMDSIKKLDEAEVGYYELAIQYFEIPELLKLSWSKATNFQKGELAKLLTSKIHITDKKPDVVLHPAFDMLYKSSKFEGWYPQGNVLRNILMTHNVTICKMHQGLAA